MPTLRHATSEDGAALAAIYNPYVRDTVVTFEEVDVTADAMGARVGEVASDGLPWLVALESGRVVGYAYAHRWRARAAYRHAVETSVYLAPGAGGRGIGRLLMEALLAELRGLRKHTAIAGVALPNPVSVRLHERLGFRKVAHFEEVGFKQDGWVDVAYWQLHLTVGAPSSPREASSV